VANKELPKADPRPVVIQEQITKQTNQSTTTLLEEPQTEQTADNPKSNFSRNPTTRFTN
jgi:hypothetical protein